MSAKLTLIPTPIDDESPLEPVALNLIQQNWEHTLLLVEEAKTVRRRWLRWGLPREAIEGFVLYNEHTQLDLNKEIIAKLKSGRDVFLMSDCGLPAFCDPGQKLVDLCHKNKIQVTATPFANSIALAVALSGFVHDEFYFAGFIPRQDRKEALTKLLKRKETIVMMDTPYRLTKLLEELSDVGCGRELFLAMDLNKSQEKLLRGPLKEMRSKIEDKKEFILILAPLG